MKECLNFFKYTPKMCEYHDECRKQPLCTKEYSKTCPLKQKSAQTVKIAMEGRPYTPHAESYSI